MSATNHTPNLNLSQFIPLDKPAWLGDYNSDMSKIDTAVHKVQTQADSMETAVEQATTAAQAATQAAQAATEAAQDAADKAQDAETTANNIAGSLAGKVNKTGDTMTGPLILSADPVSDMEAATKKYVDEHGGGGPYLPLSGGTMTGPLILPGDPTEDNQAATKKYVDDHAGGGSAIIPDPLPVNQVKNKNSGSRLTLGNQAASISVLTEGGSSFTIGDTSGTVINPGEAGIRPNASDSSKRDFVVNGMQIKKILDPTDAQDAATKAYVDAKAATKAYVDANAGGVSSYTNPTPGAHVSSCFGNAVVVGKLLIVDAVITINNILNGGDILFEFSGAGSITGDKIGGIMTAVHTNESAYISSDISVGFFAGDITVSYDGSSFGSSGNVYRVTVYAKLR